jgi:hypothetical protein
MPRSGSKYTRRDFLGQTLGAGVGLSVQSLLVGPKVSEPATSDLAQAGSIETRDPDPIRIHVQGPAGPPPLGAPVETSVPFVQGKVRDAENWVVLSPAGKSVISQTRPSINWPDGSLRWLLVVFEADEGPGIYLLKKGEAISGTEMVRREDGRLVIDSGEVQWRMASPGNGWIEQIAAPGPDGKMQAVVQGSGVADLVLTRHDGRQFRASLGGESRQLTIEERGPVRATVRVEGTCRSDDRAGLFDYSARWTMYRGRSEAHLQLTWINATENPSEQVRDIRLQFPYQFARKRLVFGCEQGVFDEPFLKDWPVHLLQEDHNQYWAKIQNPDGRTQNLSSGGCNGEHCPGWLYIEGENRCLGMWVPKFWEEYPNEIELKEGMLSVGLWPERAIKHLLSKSILPANPDGKKRYVKTDYTPVMPHPYIAFVDEEKKCLDAVQGLAKTQEIVLSVWAGKGERPTFETKWWHKSLQPIRGHLDPDYAVATGALGTLWPADVERFPVFEELFKDCFGWLDRNIDAMKCYGKFDYGDWKYFTAATDYYFGPDAKWADLGEMPREGYWQNNERDQLLGLLLYYYRSGDPLAWERAKIVARHLLDVDIKHHKTWGMWTHGYGHCYIATSPAGEPDHSWLWGALVWCGLSGDPIANEWLVKCGQSLLRQKVDFERTDARTGSVYLHMMCKFHEYTGSKEYLDAAHAPARAFLKLQNANGSWPAYMNAPGSPRQEGFVEHVIMALADYYALTKKQELVEPLARALKYTFGAGGEIRGNIGEAPLAVYGLAILAGETSRHEYLDAATHVLTALRSEQEKGNNPASIGRGDYWADWGVNNPKAAEGTGRPPQFLVETRPLSPGCVLAYAQQVLALLAATGRGRTS